ncbi:four-carbon acid sugar kinase family protein [Actinotignum sp. GS-2025b]|uniref:four-carbon acid sugar kinase family protein n=1 Tax=Actinotignum sp. GS-2025b TaxID=3427275 RepID=UPI003F4738FD
MSAERKILSGVVADDLTGATTTGALLAARGVKNIVSLSDTSSLSYDDVDALLVSTDSRRLPPEEAASRVRNATRDLLARGATIFSKRTDTTMRGGIGYEIDAMRDVLGEDYVAIIVPAMPPSKRIVVAGYSLIDSLLLARTGVANDILSPVKESYLPKLLAGQLRDAVDLICMNTVVEGRDAIRAAMQDSYDHGVRNILCDSVSSEDVADIAAVVRELGWKVLCVDPGLFTTEYALAQGIRTEEKSPKAPLRTASQESDRGTVVIVAGSATATTRQQLEYMQEVHGTHTIILPHDPFIGGGQEYAQARAEAAEQARKILDDAAAGNGETGQVRVIIITLDTTLSGTVVDINRIEAAKNLPAGQGSRNLAQHLGEVARDVMDMLGDQLAGMYATGGDTLVNTCRAIEASGIALEDYVIPQSDQGRIVGGPFNGLPMVGKGGLTGTEHTALRIVNRLFDERTVS